MILIMSICQNIIALFALIFSIYSLHNSFKLSSAILENTINDKITDIYNQIMKSTKKVEKLQRKHKKRKLQNAKDMLNNELENLCNAFNVACGFYLDGKIDKKRFKREYQLMLERIMTANHYKIFIEDKVAYSSLWAVYDKLKNNSLK